MKKTFGKKIFIVLSVIILIAGICIGAAALTGNKNITAEGKFASPAADRISLTIENTDFTLTKTADGIQEFTLPVIISINKTQADFYGEINSLKINGITYDSVNFTPLNKISENKTFDNLLLTATDSEPDIYKWKAEINVSFISAGTFNSSVDIEFTSGITKDTSVKKHISVPLKITVK